MSLYRTPFVYLEFNAVLSEMYIEWHTKADMSLSEYEELLTDLLAYIEQHKPKHIISHMAQIEHQPHPEIQKKLTLSLQNILLRHIPQKVAIIVSNHYAVQILIERMVHKIQQVCTNIIVEYFFDSHDALQWLRTNTTEDLSLA